MIITCKPDPVDIAHKHLTREEIDEIEARAPQDEEIIYDEDCPPMTDEQLRRFKRVNPLPNLAEPSGKFG